MNNCDNYNSNVTQKWLNRMEADHPPISCAKIKDWLYDVIQEIGCACSGNLYQGKYPSPLYYASTVTQDNYQDNYANNENPDIPPLEKNQHIPPLENNPQIPPLKKGGRGDLKSRDNSEEESGLNDVWKEIEEDIFSEGE